MTAKKHNEPKLADLELIMRVKLPEGGCWEGVSGNPTDDEHRKGSAWRDAIFAVKPPGYEVKWLRRGEQWYVDADGFAFVPLYVTNYEHAADHWREQYIRISERLRELRKVFKEQI